MKTKIQQIFEYINHPDMTILSITELDELKKLYLEICNLQCCGNCKYNDWEDARCPNNIRGIDRYMGSRYCTKWEFDNENQNDRM